MYEGGLENMRYSISDTAQWGDFVSGPRVINDETKERMKEILAEIQSGEFAKGWILENQANRPQFNAINARENNHLIEKVGRELRDLMRSEEHTSELQSRGHLVCRLLLEKKKNKHKNTK